MHYSISSSADAVAVPMSLASRVQRAKLCQKFWQDHPESRNRNLTVDYVGGTPHVREMPLRAADWRAKPGRPLRVADCRARLAELLGR